MNKDLLELELKELKEYALEIRKEIIKKEKLKLNNKVVKLINEKEDKVKLLEEFEELTNTLETEKLINKKKDELVSTIKDFNIKQSKQFTKKQVTIPLQIVYIGKNELDIRSIKYIDNDLEIYKNSMKELKEEVKELRDEIEKIKKDLAIKEYNELEEDCIRNKW